MRVMDRRTFLRSALASCIATEILGTTKKPNIILIYADDLGYGDVSCYGTARISTPNIDRSRPFRLYFATHDIHVPRVPHPRFAGKSGLGPRGDVILQLDSSAGEILEALDGLKIADETLVVFTSDNGPVMDDGDKDEAVEKLGGQSARARRTSSSAMAGWM
jgi:arylsulfatase A-like enzyme